MFYQLEATPASFREHDLRVWDVAAGGILPEHHHPHEQVVIGDASPDFLFWRL